MKMFVNWAAISAVTGTEVGSVAELRAASERASKDSPPKRRGPPADEPVSAELVRPRRPGQDG